MVDRFRRNVAADEQRLVYLTQQVAPDERWSSLSEEIARIERQIDRQRAIIDGHAEAA